MDVVNDFVNALMVARLTTMKLADLASGERRAAMQGASDRVDALRARLAEADDRYADVDRPDTIDSAQHMRITAKIKPALTEAETEVQRLSDGRIQTLHGLTGRRAGGSWEVLNDDRRRAVVALLTTLRLAPGDRTTSVEDRILVKWNELV